MFSFPSQLNSRKELVKPGFVLPGSPLYQLTGIERIVFSRPFCVILLDLFLSVKISSVFTGIRRKIHECLVLVFTRKIFDQLIFGIGQKPLLSQYC
jgi:hypothetical protein